MPEIADKAVTTDNRTIISLLFAYMKKGMFCLIPRTTDAGISALHLHEECGASFIIVAS
jgi:hypothetical protein